jgi:hypothetical protein
MLLSVIESLQVDKRNVLTIQVSDKIVFDEKMVHS